VGFTEKQIRRMMTPVRADRVKERQGQTYVPAHEVKAELIRTFGPGNWDSVIHDVTLVYESSFENPERGNKTYWTVCYRVACTITVRDYDGNQVCQFTEYHAEENAPQPNRGEAHALALTSCASYALRRAAIGLGDNFGLHLYDNGSLSPLVKGTLELTERYPAPKQAPETPQDTLTDAQRAALTNSLGAVEVAGSPQDATQATAPVPAEDSEMAPV
jgi:hypothetical protein